MLWFIDHYVFFQFFIFFFGWSGYKKKSLIQNSQTGVTGYHHTVHTGANSTFNFPAPLFYFVPFHEADRVHFCGFACTFPSADLQQVSQLACQRVNLWIDYGTWGTACFLGCQGKVVAGVVSLGSICQPYKLGCGCTEWDFLVVDVRIENCEKCQLCIMFPINWEVTSGKIRHYCHHFLSPFCKIDFVLVACCNAFSFLLQVLL